MGAKVAEEGERVRRRWPRVLGIVVLLLGLVLPGLWLARKPIARGQADRFLQQAGVPARYTIEDLGFGRQRLTNVVIGDPARPDLVADWLETRTAWGLGGPRIASVRGGHVRVRARWADGRLSLGGIDRLLPKSELGKPFALPALTIDTDDLRARVETPWGVIGAKLSGRGRLDNGFDGRLAVMAARLDPGCTVERPGAVLRVMTGRNQARLRGPMEAPLIRCDDLRVVDAQADVDATVSLGAQPSWAARTVLAAARIRHPQGEAYDVDGTVIAQGRGAELGGTATIEAERLASGGGQALGVRVTGDWRFARGVFRLGTANGARLTAARVQLPRSVLGGAADLADAAAGTPLDPLARRLAAALVRAGRDFSLDANVAAASDGTIRVTRAVARAPGGAEVALAPGGTLAWTHGGLVARGRVAASGGGLPDATLLLDQAGGAFRGRLTVQPYAADGARLALSPVAIAGGSGGWRVTTRADLSGPLPNGRVEGLTLPIDARWRAGRLTLAGGCAPVAWRAFALSGLRLDAGSLRLCPAGDALVTLRDARVAGGARIAATQLAGRLGATPLDVTTAGGALRLTDRGFALADVEARLGSPGRVTRLSFGAIDGRVADGGLAGQFARAAGQIGAVPLVMSEAAGRWRFARGVLTVAGALTVADAATPPRFQPMRARDVTLRLADGRIVAGGVLHEPTTGTRVATVAIRHDLGGGRGAADLDVAGLTFTKDFQPELLTRLTFGVIADVRGTVSGEGHIAWSPAGVTSTGDVRTAGTDLAAAFGPVTGLAGAIHFTDLLQLQSAPGQRFTVKSINPGVPVTDGVVTFQTLPGTRVQVEGAHWPFAGGTLTLDPTLLDFSGPAARRLTFHVSGADAGKFLQSLEFENLNATGAFDGVLPMVFDEAGGRIENGRLTARPGGGTIAYVGPINQKNLGFWGNFAFDALKSLRYRSLAITMNGPLAGEMVTQVRFAGVTQGEGAKSNFIIRRLQRLPIVFNIRIEAPFRGLLDATASFYDPKRLIERNLPELIERQNKAIQPPASETVP